MLTHLDGGEEEKGENGMNGLEGWEGMELLNTKFLGGC